LKMSTAPQRPEAIAAHSSRLTTGTRLREKTGLTAPPEDEDGQYRSHCLMSKMDSLDAARC